MTLERASLNCSSSMTLDALGDLISKVFHPISKRGKRKRCDYAGCAPRLALGSFLLPNGKKGMKRTHNLGSFADRGGNTLDGRRAYIAHGEDTGKVGLKGQTAIAL